MAFYGRQPGLGDEYLGTINGAVRASTYGAMPEHGWGYRWRGRVGYAYAGSYPSTRGEVWHTASGIPAALLGYTNVFSATQSGASTGAIGDVAQPLAAPVQMHAGAIYGVGAAAVGHQLNHGMSAAPAGQNSTMYARSIGDLGPHDPLGHTSTIWGQIASAIEYDPNLKPATPVLEGAIGTVVTSSPAFAGSFDDPNQLLGGSIVNPNEKLKQYRIQLREKNGDGSLLWNATYSANSAEQAADRFEREYAGTFTPDTWYEWRASVSDQFDAWSDWSAWAEFRIESGAILSNPRGVAGKQLTNMPTWFTVDYSHLAGLDADLVELEITQGGTPVRGPQQYGVAWAAGERVIAPNWGAWAPLDWGVAYAWRARVRDTEGLWSDWTDPLAFTTNARPQVPANLRPNGDASPSRPTLRFTMRDLDDTPATGLVGEVRLKSEAGVELAMLEAALSGLESWELALDATTLPDYGTYRWDARGRDAILASAWSTEAAFVYAPGPVVAITSPVDGGVVTSSTFTVTWTADDQVRYRVVAYNAGEETPVYTSPWMTSAGRQFIVHGSEWVRNGRSYDLAIEVENTATIIGASQRVRFTVDYPPAPSIENVAANPETAAGDRVPSIYRIGWQQSSVPVGAFGGYEVHRLEEATYQAIVGQGLDDDAEAAAVLDAGELIAASSSITETTATDAHPPSGVAFAYAVIQRQWVGEEIVESLPAVAIAEPLDLVSIVIADRDHGRSRRVVLDHLADATIDPVRRQEVLETWAADGAPAIAESPVSYVVLSDTYKLMDRAGVSALQQLRTLEAMRDPRPDGSPTVVIYRDDIGQRIRGTITNLRYRRRRLGRFDVDLELTGVPA